MAEVMGGGALDRRQVVSRLLADRRDLLVVSGLGSPSYDVMAAGDHDNNYYLWAAMGSAAMVGLGLASAQPGRAVLVVTGDGELMMGLGGFATIAVRSPPNPTIAVLDNGRFGETGMARDDQGRGREPAPRAAAARRRVHREPVPRCAGLCALVIEVARARARSRPAPIAARAGCDLRRET